MILSRIFARATAVLLVLAPLPLFSQQGSEPAAFAQLLVPTSWPGVSYQVLDIERIQDNRLLVVLQLVADKKKTSAQGVFIGVKTPIPADASTEDIQAGRYDPKPFSIASSQMVDDQTGEKYPALPAVAPEGKAYPMDYILTKLVPGTTSEYLSLQFAAPTPLPQSEQRKQTVSFHFSNATAALVKVPVPLPEEAVKAQPASAP
jgi:hypothetical protein